MRGLGAVLTLVVIVAGAWTALWFYAASRAADAFATWVAGEKAQGRTWTCPGQSRVGYPFALGIACDHPQFAGVALGGPATGSLAGLRVEVALVNPRRAALSLAGPLAFRTSDGDIDLTAGWSRLTVDLDGLPDAVTRGALKGVDLVVNGRLDDPQPASLHAAALTVDLSAPSETAEPALDFAATVTGTDMPALDALAGDRQATSGSASGRITQAVFVDTDTPEALMERWRQRGGSISFSAASLTHGPSRVDLSGTLHLDDRHRIAGALDAGFSGAEPILRRYGVDPGLVAAGSILTSLFGKRGPTATSGQSGAIRLPIILRNGRLGVGPVVTPVSLPALY